MVRDVYLHGKLGAKFGKHYKLNVSTAAEAMRALLLQLKGLRQIMTDGEYRVLRDKSDLTEQEMFFTLGDAKSLHIVPVPQGSKNRGLFKVILGVALVGIGFATQATTTAAGGAAGGAAGFFSGNNLITLGAGLAMQGIGQLLSPTPSGAAEERPSYLFSSPLNLSKEGNCIPVCYGTFYCGSLVLSAGTEVVQIDTTSSDKK